MNTRLAHIGIAVVGGTLLLIPACDMGCPTGMNAETVCETSGGGAVDAPPDLDLPPTLQHFDGVCNSAVTVGQCTSGGDFLLSTSGDPSLVPVLSGWIEVPWVNQDYTMTFPLSEGLHSPADGSAAFSLSMPPDQSATLTVVSGTLTVKNPGRSGYSVEYAFTLQTASGEIISINGGHTNVANCHAAEMCTF
jgi:hypothetical protein